MDAAEEVADTAEDVGDAVVDAAETYADAWEHIGKETLDFIEDDIGIPVTDIAEGIADGFSKEGWMTTFMEDYMPAGGLITAGIHMAAGNEDYAQMAALKGAVTALEATTTAIGSAAGGPLGAAAGAAIGNGLGTVFETALREELPESVQHLIPPKTWDQAVAEMGTSAAAGAAFSGLGSLNLVSKAKWAVKGIGKDAGEVAAMKAAKEAVEETMGQMAKTAITKKVLKKGLEVGAEDAARDMGLPIAERRGSPPTEAWDQFEVYEQQLQVQLLVQQRAVMVLEGATPEQLLEVDREIVSAGARAVRAEDPPNDSGFWEQRYHEELGPYWERAGVIVWNEEQQAEAHADLDLEILDVTLEEYRDTWIEARWAREPGAHPEWTLMEDYIGGTYMVKNGDVVWDVTDPAEAQEQWVLQEVREKGFATVEEYRESIQSSWVTAHQYQVEAGTASGEWEMGRSADLVGPYMVKDGQVVWGASTPAEAEAMLPDQLATEKGFADAEALRAELVESWRLSHKYEVENGTDTGEWQVGGQSEVVGPYMIKDGVVVFGAENEAQAEAGLPLAIAQSKGFNSIEEFKANLEESWRMSHEYDVESGRETGEWQVGGQADVVGPYMIKDGEVVYGARNAEEAEAILNGEPIPVEEPTPDDEETPADDDMSPEGETQFGDGEMETGGPYIVEDDGRDPMDFDLFDDEKPTPEPTEPTQFGDGEMETGGPYIVEDDGRDPMDFVDVRNPQETAPETPSYGEPAPMPEAANPALDQSDLIRRLMEQVERLEQEIDGLRDDLAEAQGESIDEMPDDAADPMDSGAEPMDDAFDAPPTEPMAEEPMAEEPHDHHDHEAEPMKPPPADDHAEPIDDDFDAPPPMDADHGFDASTESTPRPVSTVETLMNRLEAHEFDWQTQDLSDL
ncbi:MAG: hypothetical protein AAF081_07360, partial [Actinomycetota bacterium]